MNSNRPCVKCCSARNVKEKFGENFYVYSPFLVNFYIFQLKIICPTFRNISKYCEISEKFRNIPKKYWTVASKLITYRAGPLHENVASRHSQLRQRRQYIVVVVYHLGEWWEDGLPVLVCDVLPEEHLCLLTKEKKTYYR